MEGLSPQRGGGVATYIYGLVHHTHGDIQYTLVTRCDKQDLKTANDLYRGEARIECVKLRGPPLDAIVLARLYSVLRDFDVVQFDDFAAKYMPLAMLLKSLARVRVMLGFRTVGIERSIHSAIERRLYEESFRAASRYWTRIVCSSEFGARLLRMICAVPANRITVIPNGIDASLYRNAKAIELEGDPSILFVGHLDDTKGVDMLIRAFDLVNRQIPDSCLHLVGSGPRESMYRNLAKSLHLESRIIFHGSKSRDILPGIYKGAGIFVLPSRFEMFGNVLLEAMASEKPIVATKRGGIPEIIKHNTNGLLVNATPSDIAAGISRLIDTPELCEQMARSNRKNIEKYRWEAVSRRYVSLYEDA
jgi:glycosyltransferase involved in cell wall biosynthesis